MRLQEIEVLRELKSQMNLPSDVIDKYVDWEKVRFELSRGESPKKIAKSLPVIAMGKSKAKGKTNSLKVIEEKIVLEELGKGIAGGVGGTIGGKLAEAVLGDDADAPQPPGITVKNILRYCNKVKIAEVKKGHYIKIRITKNGFPLFDKPGIVEIYKEDGDGEPSIKLVGIVGNGEIVLIGPMVIWAHLKGEENAAKIKVTIYPDGTPPQA